MKWTFRLMAVVLLVMVALLTLARHGHAEWIAFISNRDGGAGMYLMTEDGGSVRRIASTHDCVGDLRWSPDGDWIAFTSTCDNTAGALLRVRPDGSLLRALSVPGTTKTFARWSPDGENLVAVSARSALYVVAAEGGGEKLLIEGYGAPLWSRDSNWIYTRPIFSNTNSLIRIHAQTGRREALLPPETAFSGPSWSPRSAGLVLSIRTASGDELFTMNPDGSGLTMIPVDLPALRIRSPLWSPDGAWVAFLGQEDDDQQIYRIRPDGSDLQGLAAHQGIVTGLQWSPDSRWLLYTNAAEGVFNIFRLRADGSSLDNLGQGQSPRYAPVFGTGWHPVWLMLAAVGIMMLSMMRRSRP